MSEMSGGPGYWQASDGLWYPPDAHPDPNYRTQWAAPPQVDALTQPPQAAAPVIPPAMGAPAATGAVGTYPARLTVAPGGKIANWRALVHVFMVIPHVIVLYLLGIAAQVVGVISWFVILFTGKLPEGLHNFQAMYLRYSNRTIGFMILLTEEYPPFEFDTTAHDRTSYPIRSDFDPQLENRNRVTVLFRMFMVIPQYIVLALVSIAAYFVYIVAWFAVLFTGSMPEGMRNFLVGTGRWVTRVQAYFWLLTDEYPPFSMD